MKKAAISEIVHLDRVVKGLQTASFKHSGHSYKRFITSTENRTLLSAEVSEKRKMR